MIELLNDDGLFSYNNIVKSFEVIQGYIDISLIMVIMKGLATTFILMNIIKKWQASRLDSKVFFSPWDIIKTFFYMFFIFGYSQILSFCEQLGGGYLEILFHHILKIQSDSTIKSYYETVAPSWSMPSAVSFVFSSIVIGLLDFISWVVNTTSFAGFMILRGFNLIILNLFFPFVICVATLEKFRDLAYNWIRLYFSIYFIAAVLVAANVIIDALYSSMLSGYVAANPDPVVDTSDWTRVMLVFVLVFSKVMLYRGGVDLMTKLFRA